MKSLRNGTQSAQLLKLAQLGILLPDVTGLHHVGVPLSALLEPCGSG
jgi:hypothetical protein